MALDESNGTSVVMPVSPMGNGGGFGGFGGDNGWWLILLLLCCGGGFGGFGGFGGDGMYPWLMTGQQNINANTNSGFRDAMLNDGINGIQNTITSGFGDIQTALCGGFAGVTAAVNGSQNAIAQQLYANQIADLERSFAAQTASTQGMTALQSQLASCCCDNRLATEGLKYTIATEACADRAAIADGIRDVMENCNRNNQLILDKLCQQEIDNLKAQNLELQNRVNMQNLAASQVAQTAQLIADNTAQTQYIVNRVAPYPIPAYTVANPITPAVAI